MAPAVDATMRWRQVLFCHLSTARARGENGAERMMGAFTLARVDLKPARCADISADERLGLAAARVENDIQIHSFINLKEEK
jgi:hypothetical protein